MSLTHYTSCLRIERVDGTVLCITELDKDLEINDFDIGFPPQEQTYLSAAGYTPTNMQSTSDNAVNNADLEGVLSSVGVSREDIIAGLYDFAKLYIFIWDYEANTLVKKLGSGHWGESTIKDGSYVAEFRSLSQQLQQTIGRTYNPECDAQLGDDRCKIDLSTITDSFIVDTVIDKSKFYVADTLANAVDGGSVVQTNTSTDKFTDSNLGAEANKYNGYYLQFLNAEFNSNEIAVIESQNAGGDIVLDRLMPGSLKFGDTYGIYASGLETVDGDFNKYAYGKLKFTSGLNEGLYMEVKTSSVNWIELFLPMPFEIQPGDTFDLYLGCDKRLATCKDKFSNNANHRGFPYIPGVDQISKFGGQ